MRKFINIVKHNTFFGIIIGVVICSITFVIAESINSDEVLYDNSNSSSNSDNVQDALDGLYNIVDKVGSGFALVANNTTGLSTELIGGLYRYQGVQNEDNNVDNYICFGTTNKSDCVGDTDKYMYRIIGINTNGQMKLIKKEALNTAYQWNSEYEAVWSNSELYVGLNDSYYLNDTTYVPNTTWNNKIATTEWHYATVSSANLDPLTMYNSEMNSVTTTTAKIGLLYVHDYYYSLPGGYNCGASSGYNTCLSSWLHMNKNDTNPPNTYNEWTMTLAGSYNEPLRINNSSNYHNGQVDRGSQLWVYSVRPVFFLNSNEHIASGSGTITDPYILS